MHKLGTLTISRAVAEEGDLLILKTYDGQFTLTTKKSLHIIFKTPTFKGVKLEISHNIHFIVRFA